MGGNNNVIVAGGAGYIGSHASKALMKAGFYPIVLDNLSTGWLASVKYGCFEEADLLNYQEIESIFCRYKPVAVLHFAGKSQVQESTIEPSLYWENNVFGSHNLIKSALDHDCEHFIFSSTAALYGATDARVLDESSPVKPENSYASTKATVERMIIDYSQASNLKFAIFRYFNVAGADPGGELGECHLPETHVIPILFDTISKKYDGFTIYGTDYATHDGTCIRDYVHVSDVVDAHVLALNWLLKGNKNQIFNLGSGKGFSVLDVIRSVERVCKRNVNFISGARRPGDVPHLVANCNLAEQILNWSPNRSDLDNMITDAWKWYNSEYNWCNNASGFNENM